MNLGVRGHDVPSESAELLCQKLCQLGLYEIQLVAHKSFPDFPYGKEAVTKLAETLKHYGIRVAIYGCYVDPLTEAGKARFLEHMEYAKILNAGVIATESGVCLADPNREAEDYTSLVEVFRQFTSHGASLGVNVAIETVFGHPICTPEKTKRLLTDVAAENLFVILDPVNLNHCENDPAFYAHSQKAVELYGDRIVAVHWKHPEIYEDHPAICFWQGSDRAVLIAEGLTDEKLEGFVKQANNL